MFPDRIRDGVRRLFRLNVRRPQDAVRDADAELDSIIDSKIEFLMARGMAAKAARAEAERTLGGSRSSVHESAEHRERTLAWHDRIDDAKTDIRYALRTFRRTPAFTAAAVITLALAIGANTAIYTAVSAVILRPLPYTDPDRLVTIGEDNANFHWQLADAAPANFLDWKDQATAFSGIAAFEQFHDNTTLTGSGAPRLLSTTAASGNFFTVLGVRAVMGR